MLAVLGALAGLAACTSRQHEAVHGLPVAVDNAVAVVLRPGALAALSPAATAAVDDELASGFVVAVPPSVWLDPVAKVGAATQGAQATLAAASAVLLVDADQGQIRLDVQLDDIVLDLETSVQPPATDAAPDQPACTVRWTLVGPRLRIPIGGARDKAGDLHLVAGGSATLSWEDVTVVPTDCPAATQALVDTMRSKVLATIVPQLETDLAGRLLVRIEPMLGVDVTDHGVIPQAALGTPRAPRAEVRYELVSAVPNNDVSALAIDALGLWWPLDLAIVSERDACVPPADAPAPVTLPLPAAPPLLTDPSVAQSDLVVTVGRPAVERILWDLFHAGHLCTDVVGTVVTDPNLDPATGDEPVWVAAIGALRALGDTLPVRLRLRPTAAPTVAFTADDTGASNVVAQWPALVVDVYATVDGATVRIASVQGDTTWTLRPIVEGAGLVRFDLLAMEAGELLVSGPMPEAHAAWAEGDWAGLLRVALTDWFAGRPLALLPTPTTMPVTIEATDVVPLDEEHAAVVFSVSTTSTGEDATVR